MSPGGRADRVQGCGSAREEPGFAVGYMTIAETARHVRLSERQIRKFLTLPPGQALPCYRPGRRVLIRRAEFDAWFAQYRQRGKPIITRVLRELGLDPERLVPDTAARPASENRARMGRSASG